MLPGESPEHCDPEESLSDEGLATKGQGKAKAKAKAKTKAKAKKAARVEIAAGTESAEAQASGEAVDPDKASKGFDAADPVAAEVGAAPLKPLSLKAKSKAKTQAQVTAAKDGAGTPKAKPRKSKQPSAPGGAAYETKKAYCKERNLLLRLASDTYKPRRGGPLAGTGELSEKQLFFQSCLKELTAEKGGKPRDHFKEAAQCWRDECQARAAALEAQAARDALLLSDAGSPGTGADGSGVTAAPCGANLGTAFATELEPAPGGQPDTEQPGCASPMAGAAKTESEKGCRGLALRSQKRTRKSCKGPQPEGGGQCQAALPQPQLQGQAGHDLDQGSGNALNDPKQDDGPQPAPVIMAAASASDETVTLDDLDFDDEDFD